MQNPKDIEPSLLVSAHSKGFAGTFLVSEHCKGVRKANKGPGQLAVKSRKSRAWAGHICLRGEVLLPNLRGATTQDQEAVAAMTHFTIHFTTRQVRRLAHIAHFLQRKSGIRKKGEEGLMRIATPSVRSRIGKRICRRSGRKVKTRTLRTARMRYPSGLSAPRCATRPFEKIGPGPKLREGSR